MDTAARIDILRRSGFSPQTVAAIVGVDYAEVQQFAADPSDVPSAGGGAAAYAAVTWSFTDPDFVADGGTLDFSDATTSTLVGVEVDADDSTRLLLPVGTYNLQGSVNWNVQSDEGTYRGFSMNPNYDEGNGLVPPGVNVAMGAGSIGADGAEVPVAVASLSRAAWGVAEIPFYVTVGTFADSADLEGDISILIARL